jgi:hypothetical protein
MRTAAITFGAIIVLCVSAIGQDLPVADPGVWMDQAPATARSWAMGFTGKAVVDEIPASDNPGTLGIWALDNDGLVFFNRSHAPDRWSTPTRYDLSGAGQMAGWRWSGGPPDKLWSRLAIGFMHYQGKYRWGPRTFTPWLERPLIATQDVSIRQWAGGIALDFGMQIGVGLEWKDETSVERDSAGNPVWTDLVVRENPGDLGIYGRVSTDGFFQHLLDIESPLRLGSFSLELGGAYGGGGKLGGRGLAIDGQLDYQQLPILSLVSASDDRDEFDSRGWEIRLLNAYAYRWGYREWWYYLEDTSAGRARYHWASYGHAFHLQGLAQWVRYFLEKDMPSWLQWVMTNTDIYHETAAFERASAYDGYNAPPGLQDVSIREWGVRISNIADLL